MISAIGTLSSFSSRAAFLKVSHSSGLMCVLLLADFCTREWGEFLITKGGADGQPLFAGQQARQKHGAFESNLERILVRRSSSPESEWAWSGCAGQWRGRGR